MNRLALSSLRARVLLLVLLGSLLPFSLVVYDHYEQREKMTRQIQSDVLQLASRAANTQKERITAAHQLLLSLTQVPSVSGDSPLPCSVLFAELLKQYPIYVNLGMSDEYGNVSCSAVPLAVPVNLANRAYFQRILQGQRVTLGEYEISPITAQPSINVGVPLADDAGQVERVVFASLGLDWFSPFAADAKIPTDSTLVVTCSDRALVARYPDTGSTLSLFSSADAVGAQLLRAQRHREPVALTDADGVSRLYAFARLDDEAYVGIGIPSAVAYAQANQLLVRDLVSLGVIVTIMLVSAWVFGDLFIVRRVQRLVVTTQRLSAGDWSARTEQSEGEDELSQLSRAFDQMAVSLQQREQARQESAAALRQSESLYRSLVNALPQNLTRKDLEGRFTFANQSYCDWIGKRLDEILGRTELELYVDQPDLAEKHRREDRRVIETSETLQFVDERQLPDGSTVYTEMIKMPVRDASGKTIGVQAVFWDVTSQKAAEMALRREVTELEAITRVSREIISVPDLSGVLASIARVVADLARADASGVYLFGADGRLRLAASCGVGDEFVQALNREGIETGRGAIGRAVLERRAVQIPDVQVQPDYAYPRLARVENIRAILAVPMFRDHEITGGIVLWQRQPRQFTEQEQAFLQAVAQQCVHAIENARLFEAEREQRELAEALRDTAAALNSTLDFDEVLDRILDNVGRVIPHDTVNLMLLEGDNVRVVRSRGYAQLGIEAWLLEQHFRVSHLANLRRTLDSGQIEIVSDTRTYPGWLDLPETRWIRSHISAPIRARERWLGFLNVDSAVPGFFNATHAARLQAFADQAALALENARLFDELQSALTILTRLYELGSQILTASRLEEIARWVTQTLRTSFAADVAWLYLFDAQGNREFAYGVPSQDEAVWDVPSRREGLSMQTWQSGKPILVTDPEQLHPAIRALGIQSAIVLPLPGEPTNLGVLFLSYRTPRQFSTREAEILSLFANQATLAIKRVRLADETSRRTDQLGVLNRIARAINQTWRLDDLLEVIYREINTVFENDAFSLALYDATTQELDFRIRVDDGVRASPSRRPLGDTLSARVIQTQQPVHIHDWEREPDRVPATPTLWGSMKIPRTWLGVPMKIGADIVGLINLQSYRPNVYGDAEEQLLITIADQVAVAIQRARLFEETRQRVVELEAINRISTALRVASTPAEMLPRLLDEILAVLGTPSGAIALYDSQDEPSTLVQRGWMANVERAVWHPRQGIAAPVFETGTRYGAREFATDPSTSERLRPLIPAGWGGALIPIRTAQETIGILAVSMPLPREMQPNEVNLLTTVAEMAGTAIQRAHLHEQTEQRLRRLDALHAIDSAIRASLDLRVTLNILLDQVMAQLRVDAADVLLLNPQTQMLECAAERGFRSRLLTRARVRADDGLPGRAVFSRRVVHVPHLGMSDDPRADLLSEEALTVYFAVPLIPKGQVKGVLELFHRSPLTPDREWLGFLETLAGQAAIAIDNATLFDRLQRTNADLSLAYDATIQVWARTLDLREEGVEGHTQRVADLTVALARALGISDAELPDIRRGALLHDVGRILIPDSILLKAGPLTEAEWEIVRQHPRLAYDLLAPIESLRAALDIPYCHHEKWDGTGYPRGLKGEEIPLAARIFAVMDVWDALSSERPQRPAWRKDQVCAHIQSLAGTHFDPRVVEAFVRMMCEK